MAKQIQQVDVLVLGSHPCAYFAAALLKQAPSISVMHGRIPGEEHPDRLTLLNPEFFELDGLLGGLRKSLALTGVYGIRFLGDKPGVSSEHTSKSIVAYVVAFKQMQEAMMQLAQTHGVQLQTDSTLVIHGVDEKGVDVTVGRTRCRPRLILLAGSLPVEQRKILGVPQAWDADIVHRYTYLKLKGVKWIEPQGRPLMPMSLDLKTTLGWGWLLQGEANIQIAIEQPLALAERTPAKTIMKHWIETLYAHGALKTSPSALDQGAAVSVDLPFTGALSQDGVANRTLLFGPAGGFYSACAEDIYPGTWSAVFAANAARTALGETFLQDALGQYHQKWGATLGDYLRGPQQNLRFLLPLVYRNQTMSDRLAEAILSGKSVVR